MPRTAQAASSFRKIFQQARRLSVRAGLSASILFQQMGRLEDADLILTEMVSRYPKADEIDLGLLRLAELKARQKNTGQAKSLYLKLISDYPNSFYIDQAREKIRALHSVQGVPK